VPPDPDLGILPSGSDDTCGKHVDPDLGIRPSGSTASRPPSGFYVFSFTSWVLDPIGQTVAAVPGSLEKGSAGPNSSQRPLGSPATTAKCPGVDGVIK